MELIERINELERQYEYAAYVKDLTDGSVLLNVSYDTRLVSASIIKVPVMVYVLNEVKKGNVSLDQKLLVRKEEILDDTRVFEYGEREYSLQELLTWMIINSDNTATNVILEYFGIQNINEYLKSLDLRNTAVERKMLDYEAIENGRNNYMSHEDICKVYEWLYKKEILTKELCELALDILLKQRDRSLFLRHVTDNVRFYHKTGGLDHINHDCGIIVINGHVYYAGVSVYDFPKEDDGDSEAGKIGKIIYDHLKDIPLEVVAGYIRKDDKFLLCQRPFYKARGLGWEFPGGMIEKGETGGEALKRELSEELDAVTIVDDKLCDCYYHYPDLKVHLSLYGCHFENDYFRLKEHNDARWVSLDETEKLDLCPADRILVQKLRESGNNSIK